MYEPSENYPFSTPLGEAIPLDIIKPTALHLVTVAADATELVTINNTTKVAFIYASMDAVCSFGVNHTDYADSLERQKALFVPKKHMMSVSIPDGDVFVTSLGESGFVSIQLIERWADMKPETDFSTR
jgi:hypothetical protein